LALVTTHGVDASDADDDPAEAVGLERRRGRRDVGLHRSGIGRMRRRL
jgi:hypothetical protein